MNIFFKTKFKGVSFPVMLSGAALAQIKVAIGHLGNRAPDKAAVADGQVEEATGWITAKREGCCAHRPHFALRFEGRIETLELAEKDVQIIGMTFPELLPPGPVQGDLVASGCNRISINVMARGLAHA